MKQDIAEFLIDSFIDYKGEKHNIILCALSQSPEQEGDYNLMVGWVDGDDCMLYDEDIYHEVYRGVSLGMAICCPTDKYDENIGKKIARNRAEKAVPKFVSLEQGVINNTLIRAFLHQEMEFIKTYPERFIEGYTEAKARYDKKANLEKEVKNLSNDEANIVQAAMNGVDVIKCAKLARQLLDRQIRDLEKGK